MSSANRPSVHRVKHLLDTAPDEVLDKIRKELIPYKRRGINAQQSRFLRLPDHIRIRIIDLALPECGPIFWPGEFPNLLSVCHHIRNEAAKVFFGNKMVCINAATEAESLAKFNKLYACHAVHIKKVRTEYKKITEDGASEAAKRLDERTGMTVGTWSVYWDGLVCGGWINATGGTVVLHVE